jgi:hypothetical protein
MRIEMKKEAELANRKGLANRTMFALIGMGATLVLAYLVTKTLFSLEVITPGFFYSELSVPPEVSEGMLQLAVVFLFFCGFQIIMMMGFAVISPEARTRTGKPTVDIKDPDYFDQHYNYQAQAQYSEEGYTYSASESSYSTNENGAVQTSQDVVEEWQPDEYQPDEYRAYEQEIEVFGTKYRRDGSV